MKRSKKMKEEREYLASCPDCRREKRAKKKFMLTIPLEISYDPARHKDNFMHMAFADMIATLKDGTGKEIGSVRGCMGMGIEFRIEEDGRTFYVEPEKLWNAFATMMGRKDLVMK